jgi:Ca2+-binding EF-hand superfamily protein
VLGKDDASGVNLRKAFQQYDVDNSGFIDKSEFVGLLHDLGSKAIGWKLEDAFKAMDLDDSGNISFEEFVKCVTRCRRRNCGAV